MKKMIIPGLALVLGAGAANAQSALDFKYALREITVAPFEKIRINANVHVVLVPNSGLRRVFVEGDQKMLNSISVSSQNGELVVNANSPYAPGERVLVTIPVNTLKQVDIKGGTKVEPVKE